ncbi:MAG: hypothetical protein ACLS7Z_12380 [Christensenellales bacterium]
MAGQFEQDGPLYLELLRQGRFTAAMVKDNPQINYVVMDIPATCWATRAATLKRRLTASW